MQIRLAKSKNVKALVTINCGKEKEYYKEQTKLLSSLIKEKRLALAEDKGKVLGLIYWSKEFLSIKNIWYIDQVTIDPKHRKKGVAKALTLWLFDFAKKNKIRKLYFDVHDDNKASLKLCKSIKAIKSGDLIGINNSKDKRILFRYELK